MFIVSHPRPCAQIAGVVLKSAPSGSPETLQLPSFQLQTNTIKGHGARGHRWLTSWLESRRSAPSSFLQVAETSGRVDLNLQPPGPESTYGSRVNESKALNRRRIDEQP